MIDIKICGLKDIGHLNLLGELGVAYAGLVFFPKSPRYIPAEPAHQLSAHKPPALNLVGLFVNPSDEEIAHILPHVKLDMIQLHGDESPARVRAIRSKFHLPVMKALSLAGEDDLSCVPMFEQVADWLLFDAKAPENSHIPGGNGRAFDWTLLKNKKFARPWMLSGGLHAGNVAAALDQLRDNMPHALDVSSGVESGRGIKDSEKIREFVQMVKSRSD